LKLDLQKDAQKIGRYIKDRVRDYPVYINLGPGKDDDPISLVTLGYYVEQTGYLALVFDTRPDAENDGQWTLHIENDVNVLAFPKWLATFERLCEGGTVEVKLPSGKTRTLDDSDDNDSVAQLFGETIRDCMLAARDAGVLDSLPLAPKAFFVVEEFDGHWAWPSYAKRKQLGRLRKK
jgi:hypothetical protein